jgi:hypothetical protein
MTRAGWGVGPQHRMGPLLALPVEDPPVGWAGTGDPRPEVRVRRVAQDGPEQPARALGVAFRRTVAAAGPGGRYAGSPASGGGWGWRARRR